MLRRSAPGPRYPAVLVCCCALLAACGNSRTAVPSLSQPVPPISFMTVHFPAAGITLQIPRTWELVPGRGSLVSTVSSGSAIVAIWRYPSAAPPSGARAVRGAQSQLIKQARTRDPRLRLIGSRVTQIRGAPAVVIDAVEQINGRLRYVRSTHVFQTHEQLVLEEYAPPGIFRAVDLAVFSRLEASLLLTAAPAS